VSPLGLCLAGPTASGKSALALQLADALQGFSGIEIVSVDSAQVYRGLDIGTAKPGAAERAAVPHHLIDLLEPEQAYSAARFVHDATAAAAAIRARGRLPLLVGGTMLYFRALRQGLDPMPAADAAMRAAIDARAAAEGWPALHAELARIDPASAARLAPNDAQRIQRALEVWQLTGRPLSAFHARPAAADAQAARAWPLVSLEPAARAWLHARIASRFDAMMAGGFVDEVRRLRMRPGLKPQMPSMRCVGYRQAWAALDAGTLDGLRDTGIAATRQLAKRQITWLRSMQPRSRIPADGADPLRPLADALRRCLG
jgi:tRNA dimethylallyltransferase